MVELTACLDTDAGAYRSATLPWDETFDIGSDTGTPVNDQDYQVPFKFTGKIDKLTISVEPPKLTPADIERLQTAQAKASDAQ